MLNPKNSYGPQLATPKVVPSNGLAAMPATVSNATGGSVIAAGQARNAQHNAVLAAARNMTIKKLADFTHKTK